MTWRGPYAHYPQTALDRTVVEVLHARLRDGDRCRWCAQGVSWASPYPVAAQGTYAQIDGGSWGVACMRCWEYVMVRREQVTPIPPPEPPHYNTETLALLGGTDVVMKDIHDE